jgi:hypothetical protein
MEATEASSLLTPGSSNEPARPPQKKTSKTLIIGLLPMYVFFLDLKYELIVPAQTRVIEKIYCRQYYERHGPGQAGGKGRHGIDEKWCEIA